MFEHGAGDEASPDEAAFPPTSHAAVVAWLEAEDLAALAPGSVVSGLAAVERLAAFAQAARERLLATADALQRSLDDPKEWFSEEIAAVLHADGCTVRTRMMYATDLVERLPATLTRLEAGDLSPWHARVICEAVHALPDADAAQVEELVLPRAGGQTPGQLRKALRRAVNKVAPAVSERSHAEAVAGRRVWVRPDEDGMAILGAALPAAAALRVQSALDHLADTHRQHDLSTATTVARGEQRELPTMDQYRADALVSLAEHYLADPDSYLTPAQRQARVGKPVKVRPLIQVTVALSTLLGVDDQPGELAGYGPMPASVARQIAGDKHATWRRLLTDPKGRLIDYGRTKYKPPTNLDRFVRASYQVCAFPTCTRQAVSCEIDHVIPWAKGGLTNYRNLIPLCPRHHHLKDETSWTIRHDPNLGITHWTTPSGRTYTNTADPLPISDLDADDNNDIEESGEAAIERIIEYFDHPADTWTDAELEKYASQSETHLDTNRSGRIAEL